MASPGQQRGSCGHVMAAFNQHSKCPCCHDEGLGNDPCILKTDCWYCNILTTDKKSQLATATYKASKENQAATFSPSPVDPGSPDSRAGRDQQELRECGHQQEDNLY